MLSFQTILPHTLELLRRLMAEPLFSDMRLVGGTALALQYAHRRSIDLDLFGILEPDTDKVTNASGGMERLSKAVVVRKLKHFTKQNTPSILNIVLC